MGGVKGRIGFSRKGWREKKKERMDTCSGGGGQSTKWV